ncbi:unnamed protein product [Mucor circinelloides]
MSTIYSLSEVEKHNVKGDLWLAIEGKVYNVTTFAADHPGGERAIYEEAGKDATDAFNDIGHSEAAHEWLNDYYIGDLEGFAQVYMLIQLFEISYLFICNDRPRKRK